MLFLLAVLASICVTAGIFDTLSLQGMQWFNRSSGSFLNNTFNINYSAFTAASGGLPIVTSNDRATVIRDGISVDPTVPLAFQVNTSTNYFLEIMFEGSILGTRINLNNAVLAARLANNSLYLGGILSTLFALRSEVTSNATSTLSSAYNNDTFEHSTLRAENDANATVTLTSAYGNDTFEHSTLRTEIRNNASLSYPNATTNALINGNRSDLEANITTNNASIVNNFLLIGALDGNLTNNATKIDTTNASVLTNINAIATLRTELDNNATMNRATNESYQNFITDPSIVLNNGSGVDLVTSTFSHSDTSSQSSSDNSGLTLIQDVFLDTFGHSTTIATKTIIASDITGLGFVLGGHGNLSDSDIAAFGYVKGDHTNLTDADISTFGYRKGEHTNLTSDDISNFGYRKGEHTNLSDSDISDFGYRKGGHTNLSDSDISGFGYVKGGHTNLSDSDISTFGYVKGGHTNLSSSDIEGFGFELGGHTNLSDGDISGFGYVKGGHTNLSDANVVDIINVTRSFYNISINCSNVWFDNGLGPSAICDGTDDGGGGSGITNNSDAVLRNLSITGNFSIEGNMSLATFPTCTLKTDGNGFLTCGSDDTGSAFVNNSDISVFNFNVSTINLSGNQITKWNDLNATIYYPNATVDSLIDGNITDLEANITTNNGSIVNNRALIDALQGNVTNNATKLDVTNTSLINLISIALTTATSWLGDVTGTGTTINVVNTQGLHAANISTGTFADARISESSVTQHEAALSITESQITDFKDYPANGTNANFTLVNFTGTSEIKAYFTNSNIKLIDNASGVYFVS